MSEPEKPKCAYCNGDVQAGEAIYESEAGGARPYKSYWHRLPDETEVECGYPPEHWEQKIEEWKNRAAAGDLPLP